MRFRLSAVLPACPNCHTQPGARPIVTPSGAPRKEIEWLVNRKTCSTCDRKLHSQSACACEARQSLCSSAWHSPPCCSRYDSRHLKPSASVPTHGGLVTAW